eukprot:8517058-Alexandrium_andersonii.AAC.1
MSASLVGSEMCIRDSCRGSRRGSLSPLPSAHADGADPRAFPALLRPVSYTHLTLPTICRV